MIILMQILNQHQDYFYSIRYLRCLPNLSNIAHNTANLIAYLPTSNTHTKSMWFRVGIGPTKNKHCS